MDSDSIEEDVLLLQKKSKNKSVSVGEILRILSKKGQSLMILFLALPFCQPIQIPGLSTPFGLAIAFIGLKIAFGEHIRLPKKLLEKKITAQTLEKMTKKILWLVKKMKRWVYPRMTWLCQNSGLQIINGVLIAILGLCLALPLPIPLSNLMAAWSIFFIGLGLLRNDGVFVLFGYLFSMFTFAFFVVTILLIKRIF